MSKYERMQQDLAVNGRTQAKTFGQSMKPILESGSLLTFERCSRYPVIDQIPDGIHGIDLSEMIKDGTPKWKAPAGTWLVAMVFARLTPFDPLHPQSGQLAIEKLYEPFERECPGEVGKTLKIFFQDELDFGSRMPFWSDRLFTVFSQRFGYDLRPWLAARGLAVYSGRAKYQNIFDLRHPPAEEKIILDLGDVATTAEVRVNERFATELIGPPWKVDITEFVRPGQNEIAVIIANTLANHYSVGIPSPYVIQSQNRSGLLGPVRLLRGI